MCVCACVCARVCVHAWWWWYWWDCRIVLKKVETATTRLTYMCPHYIISGEVIGFRLFRATGIMFVVRVSHAFVLCTALLTKLPCHPCHYCHPCRHCRHCHHCYHCCCDHPRAGEGAHGSRVQLQTVVENFGGSANHTLYHFAPLFQNGGNSRHLRCLLRPSRRCRV